MVERRNPIGRNLMTKNPVNIPPTASNIKPSFSFDIGEDYAFYDARTGSAPNYYQHLLGQAQSSIEIWDTYSNPDVDYKVFKEVKSPKIDIRLLTICDDKYCSLENDVKELANNIINNLNKEVKICELKVIALKKEYRYEKNLWHDRFLIIDNTYCYLVGPSLNNQVGSVLSFGIHGLSKKADADLLKKKLQSYASITGNAQLTIKVSRKRP